MRAPKCLALLAAISLLGACSPSPADTPPKPSRTTAEATAEPMSGAAASCGDSSDTARLASVKLTDTGDALRVAWVTDGTTTAAESVLWSAAVQNADYTASYQIGVRVINGNIHVFVFDFIDAHQVNLPSVADVSATGASADFPWAELGPLAKGEMEWSGALSMDGADIATCPNPGADWKNPVKATFTRT